MTNSGSIGSIGSLLMTDEEVKHETHWKATWDDCIRRGLTTKEAQSEADEALRIYRERFATPITLQAMAAHDALDVIGTPEHPDLTVRISGLVQEMSNVIRMATNIKNNVDLIEGIADELLPPESKSNPIAARIEAIRTLIKNVGDENQALKEHMADANVLIATLDKELRHANEAQVLSHEALNQYQPDTALQPLADRVMSFAAMAALPQVVQEEPLLDSQVNELMSDEAADAQQTEAASDTDSQQTLPMTLAETQRPEPMREGE